MARQKLDYTQLVSTIESGMNKQTDTFVPTYETFSTLLDKIGWTFSIESNVKDHLAIFDSVVLNYGTTVEEYTLDLLTVQDYDPNANPFAPVDEIEVKKAYHYRSNDKTIELPETISSMKRAFHSPQTYSQFVASRFKKFYDTKTFYTYTSKKLAIGEYINDLYQIYRDITHFTGIISQDKEEKNPNGVFVTISDGTSTTPTIPQDKESGETFILAVQQFVEQLEFSTRKYNPYGVWQESNKDDLILIVKTGVIPILNTQVLAGTFNKGLMELGVNIVKVDDFGLKEFGWVNEDGNISDDIKPYAILTDKRLLRYATTLNETLVDVNGKARKVLYTHHFGENPIISKAIPLIVFCDHAEA